MVLCYSFIKQFTEFKEPIRDLRIRKTKTK